MDSPSPSASDDGWGKVVDDFLGASQEDSDNALKADACKSESCSKCSDQDQDSSTSEKKSTDHSPLPLTWWARLIRIHTGQYQVPNQVRPLTVVSACAGIFSEGEAFKAGPKSVASIFLMMYPLADPLVS